MNSTTSHTRTSIKRAGVLLSCLGIAACSSLAASGKPELFTSPDIPPDTPKTIEWQAFSKTAESITGNISITNQAITFATGKSLGLQLIEHDDSRAQSLYRVTTTTNPTLLNGNRLCGNKPVDYLLVQTTPYAAGQSDMQLQAYYYPDTLRLQDLPLEDKDDVNRMMCALYTYISN